MPFTTRTLATTLAVMLLLTVATNAALAYRHGYGYGRGWCYWHPYVCYRR